MTRILSSGVHIAVGQGDEADTTELRHVKPCPLPGSQYRPGHRAKRALPNERYAEHLPRDKPGRGHYLRHECVVARGAGQMLPGEYVLRRPLF